jgi:hypothetical protein
MECYAVLDYARHKPGESDSDVLTPDVLESGLRNLFGLVDRVPRPAASASGSHAGREAAVYYLNEFQGRDQFLEAVVANLVIKRGLIHHTDLTLPEGAIGVYFSAAHEYWTWSGVRQEFRKASS